MGYNTSDSEDARVHKTWRIVILSLTVSILGGLFFAYKVNACVPQKETCKDEFFEIDKEHQAHACTTGAKVELVTAPKPGIMCHCDRTPTKD